MASLPAAVVGMTLTLFTRCPYPASETLVTVPPDGAVRMTARSGFGSREDAGSATRQKKQLTKKDLKDLAKLVRASKYADLPDEAPRFPERRHRTDVCSHSIEVAADGKTKRITYDDNTATPEIEALAKGIYGVLDRHDWVEDRYPWEEKKPP